MNTNTGSMQTQLFQLYQNLGGIVLPDQNSNSYSTQGWLAQINSLVEGNVSNWNTAYGWGDHAAAGYLDDYEEGTWTPTIEGNSGASGQTYSSQKGHYVKVGRQVTAWFSVYLSNKGTLSGVSLVIAGLPFTMENDSGVGQGVIVYWSDLTTDVSSMMLNNFANEAKAYINHAVGAGNTITQNSTTIIGATTRLHGMVTYREV